MTKYIKRSDVFAVMLVTLGLSAILSSAGCSRNDTLEPNCRTCYEFTSRIIQSPTSQELLDVDFVDQNNGWAVGREGIIVHTSDSGENWSVQDSGAATILYGLHFMSPDTGWVVGTSGKVLRTFNGGAAWLDTVISERVFTDVFFLDRCRGWVVGDSVIISTTDGGRNWRTYDAHTGPVPLLYSMAFADENHGWAVGFEGAILYTENGGGSWFPQSGGGNPLLDVSFVDQNNGWTVGVGGMILHTADGGESWTQQHPSTDKVLHGVAFHDLNNGVVVGDSGRIFTTINGGESWEEQASGIANTLRKVSYANLNTFYVAGDSGVIIRVIRTEKECCE
ncbi:MAG: YCF48-related protein [candidate division Zixibacteria bacterium]|nr:YCF48-related protein [candidate division Zixibacteria bacterium]